MGRTLLENIENYLVATDVDSNDFAFTPQPTKDIRYELVSETVFFYGTDINNFTRYGAENGYLLANLEKSAGTLFVSLAELTTFLRANTGA